MPIPSIPARTTHRRGPPPGTEHRRGQSTRAVACKNVLAAPRLGAENSQSGWVLEIRGARTCGSQGREPGLGTGKPRSGWALEIRGARTCGSQGREPLGLTPHQTLNPGGVAHGLHVAPPELACGLGAPFLGLAPQATTCRRSAAGSLAGRHALSRSVVDCVFRGTPRGWSPGNRSAMRLGIGNSRSGWVLDIRSTVGPRNSRSEDMW